MKLFKRRARMRIQVRFVPFGSVSWVMEYRIDPRELKWWQRIANRWYTPNLVYISGKSYPENPHRGWTYLVIGKPEDAKKYRDLFITYGDMLKWQRPGREAFLRDLALFDEQYNLHQQIL